MKKLSLLWVAGLLCACNAPAPNEEAPASEPTVNLEVIEDMPTIQQFSNEALPEEDIQKIVMAGVNCPSAMNGQPWHFSVVTSPEVMEKFKKDAEEGMKAMMEKMANRPKPEGDKPAGPPPSKGPKSGVGDSPVLIVISCKEGGQLDAGLACQNMNAMANLLGYGTKIASSIQITTNGDKKAEYDQLLGVPEGMSVTTSLLVGKINTENYDVVTSATPRNAVETVVTYVK